MRYEIEILFESQIESNMSKNVIPLPMPMAFTACP